MLLNVKEANKVSHVSEKVQASILTAACYMADL